MCLWELKGESTGTERGSVTPSEPGTRDRIADADDGFRKQVSTEEELSPPETVIEVLFSEFRKKWKKVFENQIK